MTKFNHYATLEVRYNDLDPQGHVNNARYLTYLEQTRMQYLIDLGLFDGKSFLELGLIVADAHIAYLAPTMMNEKIRVGTRTVRLGTKSLTMQCEIENPETGELKARAEVVMVGFDYHLKHSIPLPARMRAAIAAYEGIDPGAAPAQ